MQPPGESDSISTRLQPVSISVLPAIYTQGCNSVKFIQRPHTLHHMQAAPLLLTSWNRITALFQFNAGLFVISYPDAAQWISAVELFQIKYLMTDDPATDLSSESHNYEVTVVFTNKHMHSKQYHRKHTLSGNNNKCDLFIKTLTLTSY